MKTLLDGLERFAARQFPVKTRATAMETSVASLTFDDFPRSAWTQGGPILAEFGAEATYYVSGRYSGAHEDSLDYYLPQDLREIADAGHELGCHTFSHLNARTTPWPQMQTDIARNAAFLAAEAGVPAPRNFAYPYGDVGVASKLNCGRHFHSSRGIYPALQRTEVDLAHLRAYPLESRSFKATVVEQAIAAAAQAPTWLMFFSHDVSDDPSPYGCTPDMLRFTLDRLRVHGLPCMTVEAALGWVLA